MTFKSSAVFRSPRRIRRNTFTNASSDCRKTFFNSTYLNFNSLHVQLANAQPRFKNSEGQNPPLSFARSSVLSMGPS
jgi:hypothetical protein